MRQPLAPVRPGEILAEEFMRPPASLNIGSPRKGRFLLVVSTRSCRATAPSRPTQRCAWRSSSEHPRCSGSISRRATTWTFKKRSLDLGLRPFAPSRSFGKPYLAQALLDPWLRPRRAERLARCIGEKQNSSWHERANSPQEPTCGRSFGPPLPRLEQRDALRRAAACERPHAAQRKNVSRPESRSEWRHARRNRAGVRRLRGA